MNLSSHASFAVAFVAVLVTATVLLVLCVEVARLIRK